MKPIGGIPGDASDAQMDVMADLAERYGHDEIRISHEQNVILPHVKLDDLPALYDELVAAGSRKAMPVSSPTSSPARAWISARWRPPGPFRWRSAFPTLRRGGAPGRRSAS
jgi:hypothetical protein